MWQAEERDCTFYKYKGDKEKVLVGFNPYPNEQEFYEITIKELLYLPNVLSIYDVENSEGKMYSCNMAKTRSITGSQKSGIPSILVHTIVLNKDFPKKVLVQSVKHLSN